LNQQFYKNMALWVVILVVILLLVTLLRQDETAPPDIAYSEFLSELAMGEISDVTIEDGHISGKRNEDDDFTTYVPSEAASDLAVLLRERDVDFKFVPKAESSFWRQIMLMWFPLVLFIGLWIFFIRQMQSGGGKAMSFGK
jgi:cell division protease FtsH